MDNCRQCGKELQNTRKSYCDNSCKWKYNMLKQEREKHLPPVRKRNKNYFRAVIGIGRVNNRGAGRRSGSMVAGAMSAMVFTTIEEMQPVTRENIEKHFNGVPGYNYYPTTIKLGDGTRIGKEEIEDFLNNFKGE